MALQTNRSRSACNHRNPPPPPPPAPEDPHALLLSSDCDSDSDDGGESSSPASAAARITGLAASFRIVAESLLRMEQAELEMAKAREALRLEAERNRAELEAELTQMVLKTQLQIASFWDSGGHKRKRDEENDESSAVSKREGALALSLLQCNLML